MKNSHLLLLSASMAVISACSSSDDPTVNGPDPGDNAGTGLTLSLNAAEYQLVGQSFSVESSSNNQLSWTITQADGQTVTPETTNPLQFTALQSGPLTISATIGEGEQLQSQSVSLIVWHGLDSQLTDGEQLQASHYVTRDGFATPTGSRVYFDQGVTLHIRHNEQQQLALNSASLVLSGTEDAPMIVDGTIELGANALLRASHANIEGSLLAQRGGLALSHSRLNGSLDLSASLDDKGFINDNGSIVVSDSIFLQDQAVSLGYVTSTLKNNVFCGASNNLNLKTLADHQISGNLFFGSVNDKNGDLNPDTLPGNQWDTDSNKDARCKI